MQHIGHRGIVAAARVALVFAQGFGKIIFALPGDARHAFTAGVVTSCDFTVPFGFMRTTRISPPVFMVLFHEPWRAMKIAFL